MAAALIKRAVVEIISDLWGTLTGWVSGIIGWIRSKVVGVYEWKMGLLRGLKDRLTQLVKKKEE